MKLRIGDEFNTLPEDSDFRARIEDIAKNTVRVSFPYDEEDSELHTYTYQDIVHNIQSGRYIDYTPIKVDVELNIGDTFRNSAGRRLLITYLDEHYICYRYYNNSSSKKHKLLRHSVERALNSGFYTDYIPVKKGIKFKVGDYFRNKTSGSEYIIEEVNKDELIACKNLTGKRPALFSPDYLLRRIKGNQIEYKPINNEKSETVNYEVTGKIIEPNRRETTGKAIKGKSKSYKLASSSGFVGNTTKSGRVKGKTRTSLLTGRLLSA